MCAQLGHTNINPTYNKKCIRTTICMQALFIWSHFHRWNSDHFKYKSPRVIRFLRRSFSAHFLFLIFGVPDLAASLIVIYCDVRVQHTVRVQYEMLLVLSTSSPAHERHTLMTWIHPVPMSPDATWHWVFWCSGRLWDVLHWTELITAHKDIKDYLRLMEEKSVRQSAFKSPGFSRIDVRLVVCCPLGMCSQYTSSVVHSTVHTLYCLLDLSWYWFYHQN